MRVHTYRSIPQLKHSVELTDECRADEHNEEEAKRSPDLVQIGPTAEGLGAVAAVEIPADVESVLPPHHPHKRPVRQDALVVVQIVLNIPGQPAGRQPADNCCFLNVIHTVVENAGQ